MSKKLIKFLASLKLAVVIITVICVLVAAGTIIEAQYNAGIASKLVYRTWWMYSALMALVISLTSVMIDRIPWKRKHAPFILAHIGIILLLLGATLTMKFGLDGTLRIPIKDAGHLVTLGKTELSVYASFDGQSFAKLFQQEVDFYLNPPEKNPIKVDTDLGELKVEQYMPFALPEKKVQAAAGGSPALRFQISNERANFTEWMVTTPSQRKIVKDLGPAKVTFLTDEEIPTKSTGANEIFIKAKIQGAAVSDKLSYAIFYKDSNRKTLRGETIEGGKISTGWMGLELRVLRFFPNAEEIWEFKAQERPTEINTEAIEVSFNGKKQWMQLDDVMKFYSPKAVYVVTYGHQKVDLGFGILLKKFEIGRHQGISKAMSYQSLVEVVGDNSGDHLIAMNEPLKYKGMTFYQASFQEDPMTGQPIASIFSVNVDPGRWLKYLGSLIIVIGTLLLFYNKRKAARAQAPASNTEVI